MALKLKGSTSGFTAIDAPATAGDNTLVLPANNGSPSQYLQTNGSGVLSWATVATPTTASWTTVNTTATGSSGTVEFTGLTGSEIDQIIFSWNNLNSTGNYGYIIDIGPSSGYATSGYQTNSAYLSSSAQGVSRYTTAFNVRGSAGGGNNEGQFILTNHSGNTWQITGMALDDGSDIMYYVQGSCALSGTLDRIRVRTESGNFDAQGSATVQYLRTP